MVKNKKFKLRDLVLRKLKASNRGSKGKLILEWDGPFRVVRIVKANIYHPQDMDEKNLPHT
jgi:hypothetical protein